MTPQNEKDLKLQRNLYFIDKMHDLVSERYKSIITIFSLLTALIGFSSLNPEVLPIPPTIVRLLLIAILNALPLVLWHFLAILSEATNTLQSALLEGKEMPNSNKLFFKGAEPYYYNIALFVLIWILSYYLVFGVMQSTTIIIIGDIVFAAVISLCYRNKPL